MKKTRSGFAALIGVAVVCGTALGQGAVIAPNAFANVQGESGLNTIMRNAANPRSYQMLYSESELGGIPAGSEIIGLSWRIWFGAGAAWPPGQADWDDWEVRVSTPRTTTATMSNTFADNTGGDEVLVRSGRLEVAPGQFPHTVANPNPFGDPAIMFSTPFLYRGGDILFDIRHPGGLHAFADGFMETIGTGNPAYNVAGAAISATTFTPTTGAFAALYITEIHWAPASPVCYPDCNDDGVLDFFDFLCFQNAFLAQDPYADCDNNGVFDFFDFLCFQNEFLAGCP